MVCNCTEGFIGDTCERVACQHSDCPALARNGQCDEECFNEACGFDGGEGLCLPANRTDPWEDCTEAATCRQMLRNGVCDPLCNSRGCLFDSYECTPPHTECPSERVAECLSGEGDGECNEQCNTPQCPFDSGDCHSREYIDDLLVVYVLGSAGRAFKENETAQIEFEAIVGAITNSNPVIQSIELLTTEEGLQENIIVPEGTNLYRVTLRLDVEYCSDQCLLSVEEAVRFLDAFYASGNDIAGFSYVKSQTASEEKPTDGSPSATTPIAISITIVVVGVAGLFIVATVLIRKRKIRARIFYPGQNQVDDSTHDRAPSSKKRKMDRTENSSGALVKSTEDSSLTASCSSGDYIREGGKNAKMDGGGSKVTWVDFRVPVGNSPSHDPSDVAVVSQIGHDSRKWNYLHYSAVRNPEVMRGLLEKCRSEESKKWDVNTPGPGGYTPLMLAVTQKNSVRCDNYVSRSSSSSEASADTTTEQNILLSNSQLVPRSDTSSPSSSGPSIPGSPLNCSVKALLGTRGVKLDATNDFGRTALHLAAVCARGDFVKKLLDAGANPNVQDNWGQSPLHAAIGAAAEGAVQILISNPKTDINLKSDGGTTPLMDAVKITNMYMVKQLVKKNADISLVDYEGRTAVHWAAMTENPEALKLLIRQGPDTIKDTQDIKGQTPLFLACREGAAECAKHLLDVFANATLLDNLDRSPLTIAYERQHRFLIEMLKSHGPYHYQLPAGGRHVASSSASHVPHHIMLQQHHHHHEMVMRQQMAAAAAAASYQPYPSHDSMMELQAMTGAPPIPDQYSGLNLQTGHPEMQLPPQGQTFGDVGYPTSSAEMCRLPESSSYKHMNTSLFFSNTMHHAAENGGGVHTPTTAQQSFYPPPSTSSHQPPPPPTTSTIIEHHSPPNAYHHHPSASPPTQLQQQEPVTSSELATAAAAMSTYHGATAYPPSAYPTSSGGHFAVTTTTSDSEQLMVNELITSISTDTSPQQQQTTSTLASSTTSAAANTTRPLQHIDIDTTNLSAYPSSSSDPYTTTATTTSHHQQLYSPQQQPHSASSVHSNRSPSSLYPSPPNSDTLQHSAEVVQGNGMPAMAYSHASPPSLTPSPEGRDEMAQHMTTLPVEGLIQQHDYPSAMYGGAVDSYSYGGIRFVQDYNTETTV